MAKPLEALGYFGKTNKEVIPLLLAYLKDADAEVSRKSAMALAYLPEAVPPLLDLLKEKKSPNGVNGAALAFYYGAG